MNKCVSAPSAKNLTTNMLKYGDHTYVCVCAILYMSINIPEAAKRVFPTQNNKLIFIMRK